MDSGKRVALVSDAPAGAAFPAYGREASATISLKHEPSKRPRHRKEGVPGGSLIAIFRNALRGIPH